MSWLKENIYRKTLYLVKMKLAFQQKYFRSCKRLESSHYKLYVDNYYTSPSLFLKLYQSGINACGTARTNREYYPTNIAYKASEVSKLERGFYEYRSIGPSASMCLERQELLATKHCAVADATVTRTARNGRQQDVFLTTRNSCVELT